MCPFMRSGCSLALSELLKGFFSIALRSGSRVLAVALVTFLAFMRPARVSARSWASSSTSCVAGTSPPAARAALDDDVAAAMATAVDMQKSLRVVLADDRAASSGRGAGVEILSPAAVATTAATTTSRAACGIAFFSELHLTCRAMLAFSYSTGQESSHVVCARCLLATPTRPVRRERGVHQRGNEEGPLINDQSWLLLSRRRRRPCRAPRGTHKERDSPIFEAPALRAACRWRPCSGRAGARASRSSAAGDAARGRPRRGAGGSGAAAPRGPSAPGAACWARR
mmetsp:Transcript_18596/g.74239  ORF Transcript_18596/g.74239 Transcript_18596/m.74239 type:complete len:284 (+) Transcript_18596:428-1279(+)